MWWHQHSAPHASWLEAHENHLGQESNSYVFVFCSLVCKHKSCVSNQTCLSKQKQINYKQNRRQHFRFIFSSRNVKAKNDSMLSSSGRRNERFKGMCGLSLFIFYWRCPILWRNWISCFGQPVSFFDHLL